MTNSFSFLTVRAKNRLSELVAWFVGMGEIYRLYLRYNGNFVGVQNGRFRIQEHKGLQPNSHGPARTPHATNKVHKSPLRKSQKGLATVPTILTAHIF
jgi:hypothetical protein